MDTRILVSLRENMSLMSKQHSERFDRLDAHTQQILRALLDIQNARSTTATATAERPDFQAVDVQLRVMIRILGRLAGDKITHRSLTSSVDVGFQNRDIEPQQEGRAKQLLRLVAPTEEDENQSRVAVTNNLLSKTLGFASMTSRYEQIKEVYPATCEWIFTERNETSVPFSDFVSWLRDDGTGVYWINGKAGSGKSTLMRFLLDDERTTTYLKIWADRSHRPLCIASYFFWNSGTAQQKSQEGLLKSLLHQVLSQHPHLVPILMPSEWSSWYSAFTSSETFSFEFNLKQLLAVLDQLTTQTVSPLYLCFLIDGLDEFDGDHQELSELIIRLSNLQNVKVCVSSRPWIDYSDAFAKFSRLKLQDLTHRDIEAYVRGKIEHHPQFQLLRQEEPEATENLISETIGRAEGVFLWVTIVAKSLLRGIRNRDSIPDLQRRPREFPREIEPLYQYMLEHIDSFYQESSSQLFQIYRAHRDHSSSFENKDMIWDLVFAGGIKFLSSLSLYYASLFKTDEECIKRHNLPSIEACYLNVEVHLAVKSAGLLEIVKPKHDGSAEEARVEYLHRTAREFIESPPIWNKLLGYTARTEFNADASLLRSYVCQIYNQIEDRTSGFGNVGEFAYMAMLHAHFADAATNDARADLLNYLDGAMNSLKVAIYFPGKHEHLRPFHSHYYPMWKNQMDSFSFLIYAIQWDLAAYVVHTLASSIRPRVELLIPHIAYLEVTKPHGSLIFFNVSPRIGSFLFRLYTKPNQNLEGFTLWNRVLLGCQKNILTADEQYNKKYQKDLVSLLEQFVLAGADLQLRITPLNYRNVLPVGGPATVLKHLSDVFRDSCIPPELTENLFREMAKRGAKKELPESKRALIKSFYGKVISR